MRLATFSNLWLLGILQLCLHRRGTKGSKLVGHAASEEDAAKVAARLRTGMVHLNGAQLDPPAPFGGYKHSGVGREWGVYGLEEFLEVKSVFYSA